MTGFKLTNFSKGACFYSGKLAMFSFTLTDPQTREVMDFQDVPFAPNSSARDILERLNRGYTGADSHLDPELEHYIPLVTDPVVGETKSPFNYDKSLKPFDEVVVDTPPRERKSMAGKFVSLHEIPDNELAIKVLQARLRYLTCDREQVDYDVVNDALTRDDVILISRDDIMPQFRHRALSLRTAAPHMFAPYAQHTVEQASRVVFVWDYATTIGSTSECLWIKDKPKVKACPMSEITGGSEAADTMRDRLHWEAQGYSNRFKAPGSVKDFHRTWDDAKSGKLVMFCLNDVELARVQVHLGAPDYTADDLKPASRALLDACQQAIFADSHVSVINRCTSCCFLKGGDAQ